MTGNDIVSAITLQLKADVVEVPRRYKESQNQNIVRPCFFVKEIAHPMDKLLGNRYKRNPRYRITYLPLQTSSSIEEECRSMGEKLLESFRTLRFPDGKLFGREMSYEIVNNELLFTVEFPYQAFWREEEHPKMQGLEFNGVPFKPEEPEVLGGYLEASLADEASRSIVINGELIDSSLVDFSMLTRNTAVWNSVSPGDSLVVLKSGDKYFVLDTSNRLRLKDSIDGGEF